MTDQAHGQSTRCPIEDPRFCLGARCRLTGVCDHNRRLDEATRPVPAPVGLEREEIARIIDPDAFKNWQSQYNFSSKTDGPEFARRCADHWYGSRKSQALAKADAILALSPDHRTEPASAPIGQAEVKDVDH